jgi:6-phosphogluconolactonase (cycloisomerase 2 family)
MPVNGKRLGEPMSKKIRGLMAFVSLLGLSLFVLNCGSSNSRPAGVLFVTSQGASIVNSYAIDLVNGHLSLINTNATTCTTTPCGFPISMVMDPTGASVFVLNQGTFDLNNPAAAVKPSIYGYAVGSNGVLTSAGDVTTSLNAFLQNDMAAAMARDSAGKFLFVVTQGNQNQGFIVSPQLLVFGAQPGSSGLTLLSSTILTRVPTSVAAGTGPNGLLLYVTNNQDLVGTNDNTVSEYSLDGAGIATELVGSPYVTASDPSSVLAVNVVPVGGNAALFVYVTNVTTNNVNIFQVCTVVNVNCAQADVDTAKMLPVGSPVSVGQDPVALTIDSTNNFMYILNRNSNSVFGFRVNQTTGALTALSPATVSTGTTPVALALHPTNEFLYVSNLGSDNISGFNVSTVNGAMSISTTVTSSAQPSGLVAK